MGHWKSAGGAMLLFAAFAFLACGDRGDPLLAGHPGYPVYEKYCRRCHGHEGDAAKAARMAERPIDLAAPAYRDTTDFEEVRALVRTGKGRMPGYARKLDSSQLDAVSAYVLEMAGARPPRTP
jgi:mono/diheme cytochrome c family protein